MRYGNGRLLTGTGLLLIAAALFLCAGNLWESNRAEKSAQRAARQLQTHHPEEKQNAPVCPNETEPPTEMAEVSIDGRGYIGTLTIPALELELGILSRCTEEGLKIAPGRYTGNVQTGDLVIAAHNYGSHFGFIGKLQSGDAVILTDALGNRYHYCVADKEILQPDAVAEMTESGWPLTLFTCTPGGRERLTVRCEWEAAQ